MYININNTQYTLTDTYNKPYLHISNSILPLTTNGGGVIRCKDNNGNTYRPLEYKSISTSDTYYTTAINSEGLSNITVLTRASTSDVSYETRASTSGTNYGTRASTSDTKYGTRASTSGTNYGTRASTSGTSYGTKTQTKILYTEWRSTNSGGYGGFGATEAATSIYSGYNSFSQITWTLRTYGRATTATAYYQTRLQTYTIYSTHRYTYTNGAISETKTTLTYSSSKTVNENGRANYVGNMTTQSKSTTISARIVSTKGVGMTWEETALWIYGGQQATTLGYSAVEDTAAQTVTTGTTYLTRASTSGTTYLTRSSTSGTTYLTRTSTSGTTYLTRSSTSNTIYLTRSSTSGYSGVSSSSSESSGWE